MAIKLFRKDINLGIQTAILIASVLLLNSVRGIASSQSCEQEIVKSRNFGNLEAIVDTAATTVNEMLQLAKKRILDLESTYCDDRSFDVDQPSEIEGRIKKPTKSQFRDCADAFKKGFQQNGIYEIQPRYLDRSIKVYCDMKTKDGGWTVIQRRDADVSPREDFFRVWDDYKKGFGNLSQEFWLGNDYIFALTNQERVTLHVDLEDFDNNTRWAEYVDFLVRSELDKYRVTLSGYIGDAGDAMGDVSGMSFSAKDQDNDIWDEHCAQSYKGGWWYGKCHSANLNGLPIKGEHSSYADGINWKPFKGYNYSLKRAEMKIRPINF